MVKKSVLGLTLGALFFGFEAMATQDAAHTLVWDVSEINVVPIQEAPNKPGNNNSQNPFPSSPGNTQSTEENTERTVTFDFIEENKSVRNERDEIMLTPNQKITISTLPSSNTPAKIQPKAEDQNQSSILSFNLFLNLLYKFKGNEN